MTAVAQKRVTRVAMCKRGGVLVPSEEAAAEMLARLPEGKEVFVEVRQPRNIRAHKLFWALMGLLAGNVDWIPHKDAAAVMVKLATHEVDEIIDGLTGEVILVPRSISFESMDGTRWSDFFDRALFVVVSRWLTGNTEAELRERVLEMVDPPQLRSLGTRQIEHREAA